MQIPQAVLFVALRLASGLRNPLDGCALEEGLMPLVDRFDFEVGLVPGEVQVVLAVDLLQEDLRVPPVFVQIPGQRRLQR